MPDIERTDPDGDTSGLRGPLPLLLAGFLVLVVVGGVVDIALDGPERLLSAHVAVESLLVVGSLAFAVVLFRGWSRAAADLDATREQLAISESALAQRQAERDEWRRSAEQALAGFAQAIDVQFTTWGLTRAERDVALLLLKGDGHKQAAATLGRSERTVRQHAVEVYRKAGLQGRAELAAFFLQDLMLPPGDAPR